MSEDHQHKRRVVIICPSADGTGAVANVAIHQARELSKFYQVLLLSDALPVQLIPGVEYAELNPIGFAWFRRLAHVPNEISFAISSRKFVERFHKKNKVDLVISHGHSVATLACAPLQRRYGVPFALVTHADIFDRPSGTYDARLTWFYKRVTPRAYRKADLIFAISPHMRSLAIQRGACPGNVVVVPNGVDPAELGCLDEISDNTTRHYKNNLEVLYVGRLSVEKGVDVLLEAIRILATDGVSIHLSIAGAGRCESEYKDFVRKHDLDGYVGYLGFQERNNLGRLYKSADVVCVPSRSEPFCVVAIEAMVCGRVVVGSNIGGIPFLIENDISGFLFDVEDSNMLVNILRRLASDYQIVKTIGEKARAVALERFNWEVIGKQLVSTIEKTL